MKVENFKESRAETSRESSRQQQIPTDSSTQQQIATDIRYYILQQIADSSKQQQIAAQRSTQ